MIVNKLLIVIQNITLLDDKQYASILNKNHMHECAPQKEAIKQKKIFYLNLCMMIIIVC